MIVYWSTSEAPMLLDNTNTASKSLIDHVWSNLATEYCKIITMDIGVTMILFQFQFQLHPVWVFYIFNFLKLACTRKTWKQNLHVLRKHGNRA